MKPTYTDIKTISDVHKFYNYGTPKHPLISVIDLTQTSADRSAGNVLYRTGFYNIMYKRFVGSIKYGRAHYDFGEGALMFTAPDQVIASSADTKITEGWGLFFHPDLLSGTELGKKINDYSFFRYAANEALHISHDEKQTLLDCLKRIQQEYSQNIDKHTKGLIADNLQMLLNYCNRFYDRQFLTREKLNTDIVQKFESLLVKYFAEENIIEKGLPDVKYFASSLHLSPNYLSDLLNKFTGKTTQEHIHLHLIDKAKTMLWGTEKSISEIAYDLGFEDAGHFGKFFKRVTGQSVTEIRKKAVIA